MFDKDNFWDCFRGGLTGIDFAINLVATILLLVSGFATIFSGADYMKNGKDKYEAWNDYIKETIEATPYFYPEQEKTTLFKDKLIAEPEEVFTLKNIRVCN